MNDKMREQIFASFRSACSERTARLVPYSHEDVRNPNFDVYSVSPNLLAQCYVAILVDKSSFQLLGEWRLDRNAPFCRLAVHVPRSIPALNLTQTEPKDGAVSFALDLLWRDYPMPRVWAVGSSSKAIPVAVNDAADHVVRYALPYFDTLDERYTNYFSKKT